MREWLKKVLEWCLNRLAPMEDAANSDEIDCLIRMKHEEPHSTVRCRVIGVLGVRLNVEPIGYDKDVGSRLVGIEETLDTAKFWRLWQRYAGNAALTWADGTPVDPFGLS